jgi:hypothetical protein
MAGAVKCMSHSKQCIRETCLQAVSSTDAPGYVSNSNPPTKARLQAPTIHAHQTSNITLLGPLPRDQQGNKVLETLTSIHPPSHFHCQDTACRSMQQLLCSCLAAALLVSEGPQPLIDCTTL